MKKIILMIFFSVLAIMGHAQGNCSGGKNVFNLTAFNQCNNNPWILVFEDNFNENYLDLSKWQPVEGVPRDFNFEDQKAWHKPENIVVNNGLLKIISKKESLYNMPYVSNWNPYTVKYENFDYTTGEILTNFRFDYGKFEARVKIPKGKGFWPAFWTYGNPPWNEIDIFEFWNETDNYVVAHPYDPSKLSKVHHMTIHHDYDNNGEKSSCTTSYSSGDFSLDFHIFTLIWDKDKIEWYVDGNLKRRDCRYYTLVGQETGCILSGNATYVKKLIYPQDPMWIILNVAIQCGTDAYGNNELPDVSTPFPSQMEVDYVRYYKRISNPCQDVSITNATQFPLNTNAFNAIVGNNVAVNCIFNIPTGQQLDIIADNSITLGPGFNAELGSYFNARIESTVCN